MMPGNATEMTDTTTKATLAIVTSIDQVPSGCCAGWICWKYSMSWLMTKRWYSFSWTGTNFVTAAPVPGTEAVTAGSSDGMTGSGGIGNYGGGPEMKRALLELEGGELQVVRQNLEMSSQEALEQRGRRVRVGWHDEHAYAIPDSQEAIPEEGRQ